MAEVISMSLVNFVAHIGVRNDFRNLETVLKNTYALAVGYTAQDLSEIRSRYLPQNVDANTTLRANMHEWYIARKEENGTYRIDHFYDTRGVVLTYGVKDITKRKTIKTGISRENAVEFIRIKEHEAAENCQAKGIHFPKLSPWNHFQKA